MMTMEGGGDAIIVGDGAAGRSEGGGGLSVGAVAAAAIFAQQSITPSPNRGSIGSMLAQVQLPISDER
jgi:hypothetical protein